MNSELRQDLVSGDWILIAPKRQARPNQFIKKEKRIKAPKGSCPFEDPQKSGHGEPALTYPKQGNWQLQIVKNKYPALSPKNYCPKILKNGPYSIIEGRGYHELLITRDHEKNFPRLGAGQANMVFRAFRNRYRMLASDRCISYVSIFHNWGPKAGGSVYHPHYQIIGTPVIPPDVHRSLAGSERYFSKYKKCVHCVMINWERKHKKRIVYENENAAVFAPFVSREPFELRIFPKKHLPYFEDSSESDLSGAADALQKALSKIQKKLPDPDYNFFIHTAPAAGKNRYDHYHWHIEILPKLSVSAGFELGTGIEITGVDPDEAAEILRNTKKIRKYEK